MTKKIYLYLILTVFFVHTTYAQEQVKMEPIAEALISDTITYQKIDSVVYEKPDTIKVDLSRSARFKDGANTMINSLFGPSKTLGNADSIINRFDSLPSFGIYKDNYIVLGSDLLRKPDSENSDAKFQVSIRNRLTNSTLPFKTYAFLTYTQIAFWDVFKDSFPFRDLNFNPSVGVGKALVYNNRLLGGVTAQFEHESNGKDGDESRSWNRVSFASVLIFNQNWTLSSKVWIPIVDGSNNKDIVHYKGWGNIGMEYASAKKQYSASCVITKRGGVNLNANVTLNFSIRLFSDDNQYLFFEFYDGYGECLLNYNEYRQRFRAGIIIKSDIFNMY